MCGRIYLPNEVEIQTPQELQDAFTAPVADFQDEDYKPYPVNMDSWLWQIDTERYLTDAGASFEPPDEWGDIYVTQMPTN